MLIGHALRGQSSEFYGDTYSLVIHHAVCDEFIKSFLTKLLSCQFATHRVANWHYHYLPAAGAGRR